MQCKIYTVLAQEPGGRTYDFEAIELPTGQVVVPGDNANDSWYGSLWEVEACGQDTILATKHDGETDEWSEADIIESVTGSAREFGRNAIPESLRKYIQ